MVSCRLEQKKIQIQNKVQHDTMLWYFLATHCLHFFWHKISMGRNKNRYRTRLNPPAC